MARHSKNNTSCSSFTYHERQKLSTVYGTQTARCGRDSLRSSTVCHICLSNPPKKPSIICSQGHVACRECILKSMLEQKQEIKKAQKAYNQQLEQTQKSIQEKQLFERKAQTKLFERNLISVTSSSHSLEKDNLASRKDASFWSQLPQVPKESLLEPPSDKIYCFAQSTRHYIDLQSIFDVHFFMSTDDKETEPLCHSCLRALSTVSKCITLLPCGHVFCDRCPIEQCFTCSSIPQHTITLQSEGTGYSAAGGNIKTSCYQNAFQ